MDLDLKNMTEEEIFLYLWQELSNIAQLIYIMNLILVEVRLSNKEGIKLGVRDIMKKIVNDKNINNLCLHEFVKKNSARLEVNPDNFDKDAKAYIIAYREKTVESHSCGQPGKYEIEVKTVEALENATDDLYYNIRARFEVGDDNYGTDMDDVVEYLVKIIDDLHDAIDQMEYRTLLQLKKRW